MPCWQPTLGPAIGGTATSYPSRRWSRGGVFPPTDCRAMTSHRRPSQLDATNLHTVCLPGAQEGGRAMAAQCVGDERRRRRADEPREDAAVGDVTNRMECDGRHAYATAVAAHAQGHGVARRPPQRGSVSERGGRKHLPRRRPAPPRAVPAGRHRPISGAHLPGTRP